MKQISNEISNKISNEISKKLSLARSFEKAHFSEIQRQERPGFHLSPALGWLNDPNGFSFYKGEYHLFYQYNPYSTRWDAMHWGHWTSKDLLHWDYHEAIFAPDEDYETGVFSGTAITDKDGSHLIMYTADYTKAPDYSTDLSGKNGIRRETQCIARGDGREYQKFRGNPVLSEKDLPQEFTIEDFRDPKLWIGKDGKYYAVTVARKKRDNLGAALLFSSENAVEWQYLDTIRENDGSFGGMWECPDFFFLEGRPVLSLSVMNMKNTSPLFRNGNCTVVFVGDTISEELKIAKPTFDKDFLLYLQKYDWKGNVRELYNTLYRACSLVQDNYLTIESLNLAPPQSAVISLDEFENKTLAEIIGSYESQVLKLFYAEYPSTRKLAQRLGVSHTAIANKLKQYGIGK